MKKIYLLLALTMLTSVSAFAQRRYTAQNLCDGAFARHQDERQCVRMILEYGIALSQARVCLQNFGFSDNKLDCLSYAGQFVIDERVIPACKRALVGEGEEMQCVAIASERGLSSLEVQRCDRRYIMNDDTLSCLETTRPARAVRRRSAVVIRTPVVVVPSRRRVHVAPAPAPAPAPTRVRVNHSRRGRGTTRVIVR